MKIEKTDVRKSKLPYIRFLYTYKEQPDNTAHKPDHPFNDDLETAVLRHSDNRKWYALVMRVSHRKFGVNGDRLIDVVNMKMPTEMFGSFGPADGVYPAYHMNKAHWISVLLPYASSELVEFLTGVSFDATASKHKAI